MFIKILNIFEKVLKTFFSFLKLNFLIYLFAPEA